MYKSRAAIPAKARGGGLREPRNPIEEVARAAKTGALIPLRSGAKDRASRFLRGAAHIVHVSG